MIGSFFIYAILGTMKTERKPSPKDPSTLPKGFERLERAIAYSGITSRREAKDLIMRGLVKVNGRVIKEPGFGIVVGKDIIDTGKQLTKKESYLVYKKRGIETSHTTPNTPDLHTQYPKLAHLHPIGRLDKDSEGLIIMSNDGTLTAALTKEDSSIGKEYTVTVREIVTNEQLAKMGSGIMLDKVMTKKAIVKRISRSVFTITLFEGRKHQIRRMCDTCHLTIETLIRTKIGHLAIGKMSESSMQEISAKDIELFKK